MSLENRNNPQIDFTLSNTFKKDYKLLKRSGRYNISEIETIIDNILTFLLKGYPLPIQYRDHSLIGKWLEYRECHLKSDLLLIYKISYEENYLIFTRIGSHSELFK